MATPFVRFLLPDGAEVEVPAGGIVGRLSTAALHLHDAEISEAHALVSLRGRALKLLALRGTIEVDGTRPREVTLVPGLLVRLSPRVTLVVRDVGVPTAVLALAGLAPQPLELTTSIASIRLSPPGLEEGFRPGAPAHLWSTGDGWSIQLPGSAPEPIAPGSRWEVGGRTIEAVLVEATRVGAATRVVTAPPLHVQAGYDLARICVHGEPALDLAGKPARIVYELAEIGEPVEWRTLAAEVWPEADDGQRRARLDWALKELRARLGERGLRTNLVASSGGVFRLLLLPGDRVDVA